MTTWSPKYSRDAAGWVAAGAMVIMLAGVLIPVAAAWKWAIILFGAALAVVSATVVAARRNVA